MALGGSTKSVRVRAWTGTVGRLTPISVIVPHPALGSEFVRGGWRAPAPEAPKRPDHSSKLRGAAFLTKSTSVRGQLTRSAQSNIRRPWRARAIEEISGIGRTLAPSRILSPARLVLPPRF